MNDLEKRLRAAFDARAQSFESSPDAWLRTRERRPRRYLALRLAAAALPVALLAVFVPVLLDGGLGRNTAADADAIYQRLMQDRTPAGEQLSVDNPTEGKPLRLWFAEAKAGHPELCFVLERADAEPYGNCSPVVEEDGAEAWFAGSTLRGGAQNALDWGVAFPDVGGITGVAKDGQRLPGTMLRPAGAPYAIWTVTYPARHAMAAVEIADGAGRAIGSASRALMAGQEAGQDLGPAVDLPAGVTAQARRTGRDTSIRWLRHGTHLVSSGVQLDRPVLAMADENVIMGIARPDVTRVALVFPGGVTAEAATRPDPWSLGLTLFAVEDPTTDPQDRFATVAYDASGTEIWREEAATEEDRFPPVGEVMTIPGTEGSGEPVRAWFTGIEMKGDPEAVTLCRSGGLSSSAGDGTLCTGGSRNGMFNPYPLTRYLPEPGTVTYLGVVGKEWKAVTAVLSDGTRVRAGFLRGTGTPAPIWHVTIPRGDVIVSGFTVQPENGPLERHPEPDRTCGRRAAGAERQQVAAGVSAAVAAPGCVAFFEGDQVDTSLPGPLPGEKLSGLLDAERPMWWRRGRSTWYGYALPGTARVELVTSNGLTSTATAVPDRFGQGVTLFAGPVPEGGEFSAGMVVKGFDAAGEQLWQSG
ncbi:hypothetical protein [Nonomuraea gerenzanensis]|uniref:Uncharacterized protein n=1 Tax=Nonomuraea gerenzanensis TaxID=93944 RepID=A0A1M4EKE7_9ACTN|nr:hypothetical protein [Nonomuraea gerenzanensis]UBU10601.1 hypothetical protein LCN96_40665 [Nonomuraea gerenzanensis]SBO99013.1 hypothetical protein BN4615_P8529 [Nonomuraea gerenzanensis]